MSDDPPRDLIVPPFMSKDWRLLRAKLNLAAAHAVAASESSTIEEVAKQMGEASIMLIDADFIRRRIERKEPDVDDHRPDEP